MSVTNQTDIKETEAGPSEIRAKNSNSKTEREPWVGLAIMEAAKRGKKDRRERSGSNKHGAVRALLRTPTPTCLSWGIAKVA
jgi:hypothetical protein